MLRRLVVPLDGSELAERALPYATQLAQARDGRLVLVRVALAPPPSGFNWEEQQLAAISQAEQYLAEVAEKLNQEVPTETSVPYGKASARIVDAVREFEADGVVMATHGRTGPAHLLYGSVAEAVLAASPVPVLLVQAQPGQDAVPFDPTSACLLVPLDGSAFAEAAVPTAVDVLGPNGELVLVRVVAPADHVVRDDRGQVIAYLDQMQEHLEREASDYLYSVVRQLVREHADLKVRPDIRVGDAAVSLAAAAAEHRTDLIVMASHGRTGLQRAVLGSVAGSVLRTTRTPVLLVHPGERPPTAPEPRDTSASVLF
jgi:nucleotide-binding universal stress UspA family protein